MTVFYQPLFRVSSLIVYFFKGFVLKFDYSTFSFFPRIVFLDGGVLLLGLFALFSFVCVVFLVVYLFQCCFSCCFLFIASFGLIQLFLVNS